MSSAIPARLQFQCGHAALVTLPRIKGETATLRNERIAREKTAALTRQCDFCAPAVALVSATANGNGTHVAEPEPVLEIVEPVVELAPQVEAVLQQAVEALEEAAEAAEAVSTVETEIAAEVEAEVEALAEVAEIALAAEALAERQAEATPPAAASAHPTLRTRRSRKPRSVRTPEAIARGRRFLVEYQVERVLQAADIHDALRQVAAFGPSQVVAITREY